MFIFADLLFHFFQRLKISGIGLKRVLSFAFLVECREAFVCDSLHRLVAHRSSPIKKRAFIEGDKPVNVSPPVCKRQVLTLRNAVFGIVEEHGYKAIEVGNLVLRKVVLGHNDITFADHVPFPACQAHIGLIRICTFHDEFGGCMSCYGMKQLVLHFCKEALGELWVVFVILRQGKKVAYLLIEPLLRSSNVAYAFKQFIKVVPRGFFHAFILHMIETLKPGTGRMGVVVPHGVLFRASSEGEIRKQLIKENLLDMVIGLPEKLFYGTGIPAAILVFRKNKKDNNVLFIDASREYQDGKNQNFLRDEDIQKVLDTAKARESVDKYAYLATLEEIRENDFNLNIPRYVDTFEEEEEIDLEAVLKERKELKADLAKLEVEMEGYLKELGYLTGEE